MGNGKRRSVDFQKLLVYRFESNSIKERIVMLYTEEEAKFHMAVYGPDEEEEEEFDEDFDDEEEYEDDEEEYEDDEEDEEDDE